MKPRVCISLLLLFATALEAGCAAAAPSVVPEVPGLPTSAQVGGTNIVAIGPPAQPCCPKQTLPQFLGINGLFKGIGGLLTRLRNRLGSRFPGLEAKPELLAITDPANLESSNPAVKEAAEVKAEEDQAAQKAKAIRYLASIGCTDCYPDIEDALLAALDDCTEVVRYEAVAGLRSVAGNPCKTCRSNSCCSPKIIAKLDKMANQTDAKGCPFEPSERIRRIARLGLAACGGSTEVAPTTPEGPLEGPAAEPIPAVEGPIATRIERSIVVPGKVTRAAANVDPTIHANATLSFQDVLTRYQDSPEPSAKVYEVRWERIVAPVERFHSREDARAVMLLLRTRALGAVQPTAIDLPPGGIAVQSFPWTLPGAVHSAALSQALQMTPIGGISPVFDEAGTVQMIRVLERREAVPIAEPVVATAIAIEPVAGIIPPPATVRRPTQRLPDCDCRN